MLLPPAPPAPPPNPLVPPATLEPPAAAAVPPGLLVPPLVATPPVAGAPPVITFGLVFAPPLGTAPPAPLAPPDGTVLDTPPTALFVLPLAGLPPVGSEPAVTPVPSLDPEQALQDSERAQAAAILIPVANVYLAIRCTVSSPSPRKKPCNDSTPALANEMRVQKCCLHQIITHVENAAISRSLSRTRLACIPP